MALAAPQHAQLATAYEQAAADGLTTPEQQAALLRKANCFRILARLAEKNELVPRQVSVPPEFSKPEQGYLSFAFERFLSLVIWRH